MKKLRNWVILFFSFVLCACGSLTGYSLPYDENGFKGKNAATVIEEFEEAGFTDIHTKVINDLPLEKKDKVGEITSITINDEKNFEKDSRIALDSKIVITYHDLKQHKTKIHVNFEGNWFFNKYDVKMSVDKEHSDVLKHGETKDFEYDLKEGEYTIKFSNVDDKKIKGQSTFKITGKTEVSYTITCQGDKVEVVQDYINQPEEVDTSVVKINGDVESLKNMDYKETVNILHNLGFTNIQTIPVYDIRYGITIEETTADVTIAGKGDFKDGDTFKQDDSVVVYYHMKEEKEPGVVEVDKNTEYDKAYRLKNGDAEIYYLFDKEQSVVTTFKTDEKGVSHGTFTGDLDKEVEMIFNLGDNTWKETAQFKEETVTILDARHYSYVFEQVDVKDGQAAMEKVKEK